MCIRDSMRRDLRVITNSFAEYQIGFGNSFYIKSMNGYNIKTSAFRIAGIQQNVYLSDIPNSDAITGSLFLFTLPSVGSQDPTIVRRNVGTINYASGVITINPINVLDGKLKDGLPIIEIEASPSSNDVVGLQDLYLQLDTSSSYFDTVVDEIASGLDPSASNYIVSSSYPNGNLVRAGGPTTAAITNTAGTTTSTNTSATTAATTVSTSGGASTGSSSY